MRKIRLTEGQLHNVIRESVSQILNEIDWKTYDNAAKKRHKQMPNKNDIDYARDIDYSRRKVWPLRSASLDALAKKYPHFKSGWYKDQYTHEPLTPEEQADVDNWKEEFDNQRLGKYKYGKGGRGYYVDDED